MSIVSVDSGPRMFPWTGLTTKVYSWPGMTSLTKSKYSEIAGIFLHSVSLKNINIREISFEDWFTKNVNKLVFVYALRQKFNK